MSSQPFRSLPGAFLTSVTLHAIAGGFLPGNWRPPTKEPAPRALEVVLLEPKPPPVEIAQLAPPLPPTITPPPEPSVPQTQAGMTETASEPLPAAVPEPIPASEPEPLPEPVPVTEPEPEPAPVGEPEPELLCAETRTQGQNQKAGCACAENSQGRACRNRSASNR